MKKMIWLLVMVFVVCLAMPQALLAGKGYMGGQGSVVVEEPAAEEEPTDTGGVPDTVEGPLNDKMSDAGKLYGDLYVILRQQGVAGDKKLVPSFDDAGDPVTIPNVFSYSIDEVEYSFTVDAQVLVEAVNDTSTPEAIVGGEPVLTVIDPGDVNAFADYGWYAAEIGVNPDETPIYGAAQSPYPAQCVQPVADYARWGDISSKTGLTENRLPLVITYDPTWGRSECAVGELSGEVVADPVTGALTMPTNEWFVDPCDKDDSGVPIPAAKCQWEDDVNGVVTYPEGVLWTDLIKEVGFGRLNISRSPEAVLQSSFDEAINNLNSPDTIAIESDAAGRLLLTKNVYDPLLVDQATGLPLWLDKVKKAIDSPLENVALYVKLMKDGHLVTPGDERAPLDRSKNGGIPIWKLVELTDGPGAKALRPTIDIAKLEKWGMGNLVDVTPVDYLTYYICLNDAGGEVPCLIWDYDPVQPELGEQLVGNPAAVSRDLITVLASDGCPIHYLPDGNPDFDNPYVCEGPFTGIMTDDGGDPVGPDLDFAAAAFSAAADKTGHVSLDMIVYLNSILGINKVLGYSEYDVDGNPTEDAIDYEKNPVYFNYHGVTGYNRGLTFGVGYRGQVTATGGDVDQPGASTYDGNVKVLWGGAMSGTWTETTIPILDRRLPWDYVGWGVEGGVVVNTLEVDNILGFTQMADDNLSVIKFIHTYQIPGLR